MNVSFALNNSIYDCKLQITDAHGSRYYLIPALTDEGASDSMVTVDIFENALDLTLVPLTPDLNAVLAGWEETTWKDKLAKKATVALGSSLEKMLLRVGCRYHIDNVQDGDRVDITLQNYLFGRADRFDLLGLLPMMYAFFEVSHGTARMALVDAYETNRKDVVKYAKMMALTDILGNGIFSTLFSYPLQVSRIKHLSKNKTIRKTLMRFSRLSEPERQRFLEKQERFFDR